MLKKGVREWAETSGKNDLGETGTKSKVAQKERKGKQNDVRKLCGRRKKVMDARERFK